MQPAISNDSGLPFDSSSERRVHKRQCVSAYNFGYGCVHEHAVTLKDDILDVTYIVCRSADINKLLTFTLGVRPRLSEGQ